MFHAGGLAGGVLIMRVAVRSLWVAVLAMTAVISIAASWTLATAIHLLATTALIMGGTDHPLVAPTDLPPFVTAYLNNAVNGYLNTPEAAGAGLVGPVNNAVAVYTPEEFFPVFGSRTLDQSVAIGLANLHHCVQASGCVFNNDPAVQPTVGSVAPVATDKFDVFGYSQSSIVASLEKQALVNSYQAGDPSVSFNLVSNPMRPNGGILERFFGFPSIPFFGISFYGPTPTNSAVTNDGGTPNDPTDDTFAYPTIDVAQQYDALGGDFPDRPLNLLADINSFAAYALLHGNVVNQPIKGALFQGSYGDTTYYMFPTPLLPILMPLQRIGLPNPILDAVDALLRPVIEDSYVRGVNPGVPVPMSILPIGNPIGLAVNLVLSIPVAIDNALEDLGIGRVLGTTRPGPFGVGGPPLPDPPVTTMNVSALSGQQPVVQKNDTESVAPQVKSLTISAAASPAAESANPPEKPKLAAEPDTRNGNGTTTVTVEANNTNTTTTSKTTPSESTTGQLAEPTTPETKKSPASTAPERPKVRGPIEFDGPKKPKESPSTPAGEHTTTALPGTSESGSKSNSTDSNSTGSVHKDAA
jgi:hypothetical protein